MYKIYVNCPIFTNETVTLRLTNEEDAKELFNCYSDEKAAPLFNSDNCNGDTFYYTRIERLKQTMDFWEFSYKTKQFVRMTIIFNKTKEKIGTIEMFNRGVAPYYGVVGVLRLDIMSRYENEEVLNGVLGLVIEHFYEEFGVEWIITKATDIAGKRREVLAKLKFISMDKFIRQDYYGRIENEN